MKLMIHQRNNVTSVTCHSSVFLKNMALEGAFSSKEGALY